MLSKVIGCKRDHHGRPIGQAHDNPILDTRVYEIEFPDGHVAEYTTNEIAESLYAQIDEEGFDTGLISLIIQYLKIVKKKRQEKRKRVRNPYFHLKQTPLSA